MLVQGDVVVCEWRPEKHHEAFRGMLNGGITGALLDCHSKWTAAHHLLQKAGLTEPPCTVMAEYSVKLRRPISTDGTLFLRTKVVESTGDRPTIEATLEAGEKVCAT